MMRQIVLHDNRNEYHTQMSYILLTLTQQSVVAPKSDRKRTLAWLNRSPTKSRLRLLENQIHVPPKPSKTNSGLISSNSHKLFLTQKSVVPPKNERKRTLVWSKGSRISLSIYSPVRTLNKYQATQHTWTSCKLFTPTRKTGFYPKSDRKQTLTWAKTSHIRLFAHLCTTLKSDTNSVPAVRFLNCTQMT